MRSRLWPFIAPMNSTKIMGSHVVYSVALMSIIWKTFSVSRKYCMKGRTLGSSVEQRDLSVFVHRSLKAEGHVSRVVKKACGTLASINRGIDYKSREVMLEMYRTLVRPQLEYCVQFWSPHYVKDVIALEGVQRRFTRMLHGMEHLNYEERLDRLGLFLLRGDLIEVYTIMRGMDRVDKNQLFPLVEGSVMRGHRFK